MEKLRQELAGNMDLVAAKKILKPSSSSSETQDSTHISIVSPVAFDDAPPHRIPRPIDISSDEEDTRKFVPPPKKVAPQAPILKPAGVPIKVPSNKVPSLPIVRAEVKTNNDDGEENILVPDFNNVPEVYQTKDEAEKALRDLMAGGFDEQENSDHVEINMDDAVVPGLRDKIRLLPHQILGRKWMTEREDVSLKRHGGILADDMGLGKTIQTIARIVEGRARKADKRDGWAASTLVVCPLSLVGQWASEIDKMAVGLTVVQHHGPSRTNDPERLKGAHVVITTYQTLASEYAAYIPSVKDESKAKAKKTVVNSDDDSDSDSFGKTVPKKAPRSSRAKKDALLQIKWWRVVLDEAHNIKNRSTKAATACCALEAKFRWCLTGTPLQNNVDEVYSLIKFLRIKPLNDWSRFKESISQPIQKGRGAARAMKRLQALLKTIMLRRRKDQLLNGKPLIELPARNLEIRKCQFDSSERAFYGELEEKMGKKVKELMEQEKGIGSSYTSVLLLLLRLRQACNHPALVEADYQTDFDAVEPKDESSTQDGEAEDKELTDMFKDLAVAANKKCGLCQTELTVRNSPDPQGAHCNDCIALVRLAKSGRPNSAKIRMILQILREIEDKAKAKSEAAEIFDDDDEEDDEKEQLGPEKTIIFSQFTSMLDLIEPFLRDAGVRYVRYDGKMKPKEREDSLKKIKESDRTRVILISFKAGSTGLNLTSCNHVILVDMWWNPALEDQAFDRAHRFGQKRDVSIYKLKIDETVEERILALQDKKRMLSSAALSGDKIKNMKLGINDLLELFRVDSRDDDSDEEEDSQYAGKRRSRR